MINRPCTNKSGQEAALAGWLDWVNCSTSTIHCLASSQLPWPAPRPPQKHCSIITTIGEDQQGVQERIDLPTFSFFLFPLVLSFVTLDFLVGECKRAYRGTLALLVEDCPLARCLSQLAGGDDFA